MAAKNVTVDALYHVMQSIENKLGGGEGVEGVYGSITQTGMQKVINCLVNNCKLGSRSVLVDIGAGLGRPLLHALLDPGVADVFGVEMDSVKVQKAVAFGPQVLRQMDQRGILPGGHQLQPPEIRCASVEQVSSLEPATHAYSFWEGVPIGGKEAFGKLFAKSKTLKAVAVVQRAIRKEEPTTYMSDMGFGPLVLIRSFPVKMSGSGRSFQAYIFSKLAPDSTDFTRKAPPMTTPCTESSTLHPTASLPEQPFNSSASPHIHTLDHSDSMDSTQSGFAVEASTARLDQETALPPAGTLPSRRARTSRGEASAPPPSNNAPTSAPVHPTVSPEGEESLTTATATATAQSPAFKPLVQKTITSFTKISKTAGKAAKADTGKGGVQNQKGSLLGVSKAGSSSLPAAQKRQIAAAALQGLVEVGTEVSVRQAQASSRELRRQNRGVNTAC